MIENNASKYSNIVMILNYGCDCGYYAIGNITSKYDCCKVNFFKKKKIMININQNLKSHSNFRILWLIHFIVTRYKFQREKRVAFCLLKYSFSTLDGTWSLINLTCVLIILFLIIKYHICLSEKVEYIIQFNVN